MSLLKSSNSFRYQLPQNGPFQTIYPGPGRNPYGPVNRKTSNFRLDAAPSYDIPPYQWGTPNFTETISVQGSKMQVKVNTFDTFQGIRQADADAVRINQEDTIEKYRVPRIQEPNDDESMWETDQLLYWYLRQREEQHTVLQRLSRLISVNPYDWRKKVEEIKSHNLFRWVVLLVIWKLVSTLRLHSASFWAETFEKLSNWLSGVEPPKEGLHRIRFSCGCGKPMLVDVRELRPGGVERFRESLVASVTKPQEQALAGCISEVSGIPRAPEQAHIATNSVGSSNSHSTYEAEGLDPPRMSEEVEDELGELKAVQSRGGDRERQFLPLCVNTRNLTTLRQIDLQNIQNDEDLINAIRNTYWEARQSHSWHYGMVCSQWLVYRMPVAWRDWLATQHLLMPKSAEVIKFQLRPYGTNLCPDKIGTGLPPEDQVKIQKNYYYDPCPTDVALVNIPNFSHLLKPGPHSGDFWLKTLPKKRRTELEYRPGVIGWGLQIHEGWNWFVILLYVLALELLFSVAVVLYAACLHDPATAFGFGSFAVSFVTLMFSVKYCAWKEREI